MTHWLVTPEGRARLAEMNRHPLTFRYWFKYFGVLLLLLLVIVFEPFFPEE